MAVWQAVLLGLVQGVTGFLPVSSSGHLNLLSRFLGIQDSVNYMILIFLHLGSILGVFCAFRKDISRLFRGFFGIFRQLLINVVEWQKGWKDPENVHYRKLISSNYGHFSFLMAISLTVTFFVALALRPFCNALSGNLLLNGMGFFMTALLLIVCSFTPTSLKGPKDTKILDACIIGLFQGFSSVPGISLLGMNISAGYLCGLTRKFLIKYAYIMTIPVLLGGSLFQLGILLATEASIYWVPCLVGMAVAALVGFFMITIVREHITVRTCRIFAGYCIVVGCVSVLMYLI